MKVSGTLYQAKSGAVFFMCGKCYTELTKKQIDDLHICVYELDDFSFEDFKRHYGCE